MNTWLLSSALLLALIGSAHTVLGERRIFRHWRGQSPAGVVPYHRIMLRGSWHLASLLGFGQAGALAWLALAAPADLPAVGLQQALLACLGAGVLACGGLVVWITRGRHPGGTALVAAAGLMALGMAQVAVR